MDQDLPIKQIRRELDAAMADLLSAVGALSQSQLDWRPAVDRWSVGEVLDHIALYNESCTENCRRLLEQARRRGQQRQPGDAIYLPLVDQFLLWFDARGRRMGAVTAPPVWQPTHGRSGAELLRRLTAGREALLDLLAEMAEWDLAGLRHHPHQWVRVWRLLPFPVPTLTAWGLFRSCAAHVHRHLTQIQQIMSSPGFPSGQPGTASHVP